MSTKLTLSTIALALVAASSVAHAQSVTATPTSEHTLTRAEVLADLNAWRASGLEQANAGQAGPDVFSADYQAKVADYRQLAGSNNAQAAAHTLTRSEVIADLDAWRASGLEQANAGKAGPDVFSADYQAKAAKYEQLTGSSNAHVAQHSTTRAEVVADLNAWRASGLAQAYAGKTTPDVFSPAYQAKLTRYRQLTQQS